MFSRQCLGAKRIPDLKTLRRQARAWNRRTNRAGTKINWQFDRRAARRKFHYKKHSFKRSKNWGEPWHEAETAKGAMWLPIARKISIRHRWHCRGEFRF